MRLLRIMRISWRGLRCYPVRTALAILGMAIGSLLVIFCLAVLHNFEKSLVGQFQSMGVQQIVAIPGKLLNHKSTDTDVSGLFSFASVSSKLSYEDSQMVQDKVKGVDGAAPQMETIELIQGNGSSAEVIFTGTTADYPSIFSLAMLEGRFLQGDEVEQQVPVMVLGHTIKQLLFGDASAVGQNVNIMGKEFKVIGVFERKEMVGYNFDERVYISYPMLSELTDKEYASMIFFKLHATARIHEVEQEIDQVLRELHGVKDYNLVKPDEALRVIQMIMNLVTALTMGISGVSFLVGGIGIMNVMLLTVKERTREIGIRKATGARDWHIVLQFLFESIFISFIGLILGILSTFILLNLVHFYFPILSTELPLELVGISVVFSAAFGLFFGLIPAYKALSIEPIDALRYE